MLIDIDPAALRCLVDNLNYLESIDMVDPEDKQWWETTERTMAFQAQTWDLMDLLGDPTPERNSAIDAVLARNPYYRPMSPSAEYPDVPEEDPIVAAESRLSAAELPASEPPWLELPMFERFPDEPSALHCVMCGSELTPAGPRRSGVVHCEHVQVCFVSEVGFVHVGPEAARRLEEAGFTVVRVPGYVSITPPAGLVPEGEEEADDDFGDVDHGDDEGEVDLWGQGHPAELLQLVAAKLKIDDGLILGDNLDLLGDVGAHWLIGRYWSQGS